jgi:hypothetical protein
MEDSVNVYVFSEVNRNSVHTSEITACFAVIRNISSFTSGLFPFQNLSKNYKILQKFGKTPWTGGSDRRKARNTVLENM